MEKPDPSRPARNWVKWLSILPVWNAIVALVGASITLGGRLQVSTAVGPSAIYLLLGSAFLALLGLVTGVAIWTGPRWGWWLATYYFWSSGLRSLNVLLSSLASGRPGCGLTSPLLDVVLGFGVAIYLFTPGALGWFGVSLCRKWPSALLRLGAAVGTVLLFLLLALFL